MIRLAIDFENPSRTWWESGGQELWDGIAEAFDITRIDCTSKYRLTQRRLAGPFKGVRRGI